MFVLFVIALIESIGTPRFGFDEIGIDPTVIAEAVPSLAIRSVSYTPLTLPTICSV